MYNDVKEFIPINIPCGEVSEPIVEPLAAA